VNAYRVEPTPGETKKLRRKAGDAQLTFAVTRAGAKAFASALLSGDPPCERAALVVEETSGALYHIGPLIEQPPLESLPRDTTITATGREAAEALLAAALSDYVDFWFVPTPGGLLVYADNDEYATVFAHRQGPVSKAGERLRAADLTEVTGYRWTP
jgi:hypothetical protein